MNILIIGAGEIGKAIEFILKPKKEIKISFWDKNPEKIPGQKPLSEAVPLADFIFICVPSFAYIEVINQIKSLIKKDAVVISLTKGLDLSGKSVGEILGEELKEKEFGLLAGPMLAEEITQGKKAFAVFTSVDKKSFEKVLELFKNTSLSVLYSDDVLGTSICSVLKNVYAVLFGILDGLNLGNDVKGELTVKVLTEMTGIVSFLGGKEETALGLAGLGDFLATSTSKYSKNYQSGVEIAKNKKVETKGEGITSFEILKNRLGEKISDFSLLKVIGDILEKPEDIDLFAKNLV
ncbi:NAD(P)-binding domain-containing protein [Candidatus Wolfebacteria bacterium]|nr:NAD(P)-binding domain-containing protein [Candidatus Wolfebacteria bacterium]